MAFVARTNAEAHLYMDLHPCVCGESEFQRSNAVVEDGDELVSLYEGPCAGCGITRTFEFALPDAMVRPTRRVRYGGDDPSTIIDPGEFMRVADAHAKLAPAAGPLDAAARRNMQIATAALEEVLKFIPDGADAVPETAFVSEPGRQEYAREPGRFARIRLEAVLGVYLATLGEGT